MFFLIHYASHCFRIIRRDAVIVVAQWLGPLGTVAKENDNLLVVTSDKRW